MSENINCPYCGESYPQDAPKCPLCGSVNHKAECNSETVTCACCGEVYSVSLSKCPICGVDNRRHPDNIPEEKVECTVCGGRYAANLDSCPGCRTDNPSVYVDTFKSTAEIIDEDVVYELQYEEQNSSKSSKQQAPNKNLVLACFVGLILLVVVLFVEAASGISSRASSKIGAEIFETQDYDYQRDSR